MSFIHSHLEDILIEYLYHIFGIKNAIRFEDMIMILIALLLGYFLGQIRSGFLVKSNFRFNENMKNLVFQRCEHMGVIEYDFKRPHTALERLEFMVGMHLANRMCFKTGKREKLTMSEARWYAGIASFYIFLIIIMFIIVVIFAVHVIDSSPF